MTSRVPLTIDTSTNTIEELPNGDDLNLSGSNISNVVGVNSTGNITTTANIDANNINATSNIIATGNVTGNYILGNGSQLTGIVSSPGGNTTELQYNNAGNFAGIPNVTFASGNLSLGNVANVKMSGGSNNQVVKTDGSGNLSFTTISGDSYMLEPVRAGTTQQIALSGSQTIDGISVSVGDRVLVRRQNNLTENGIYIVASGAWTRATDFNTGANTLKGGVTVTVREGLYYAGVTFVCTNTTSIVIGTSNISWGRSVGDTGLISIWTAAGAYEDKAYGANASGALAIGVSAKAGTDGVSIGYVANVGGGSVGIGYQAFATQSGVAIGINSVAGTFGTVIGYTSKTTNGVTIGAGAGSITGANNVVVGLDAGKLTNTSNNRVTIGTKAHESNSGDNSIAIGYLAARTNAHANTIVLNATGANLDTDGTNRFFVKPIRKLVDPDILMYDPTTGEIVYDVLANYTANINANNFVATTNVSATNANIGNGNIDLYANGEINSTGLITTTGNSVANNVNATTFMVLSSNTASNLASVTGVAGALISVSDQDYQPAYWSVTDSKWKYVSNRANV